MSTTEPSTDIDPEIRDYLRTKYPGVDDLERLVNGRGKPRDVGEEVGNWLDDRLRLAHDDRVAATVGEVARAVELPEAAVRDTLQGLAGDPTVPLEWDDEETERFVLEKS